MPRIAAVFCFITLLASCATGIPSFDAGAPCEATSFNVVDDFGGARRGRCEVLADNHVRLWILPEDAGYINPSPWFAFRLEPNSGGDAIVSLQYVGAKHRYVPKSSSDGISWTAIDASRVQVSQDEMLARIEVSLDDEATWIAAQELITPNIYDAWNSRIAASSDAELLLLGESLRGLPIHYLQSSPDAPDVVLIVGRQHPPEVSGSIAFFAFAETLFAETEVARRFREQFQIVAIPLLNPDGVLGGNWRHNLGGTDLNRDWGTFEQPETRLVGELLDRLDAEGASVRVFLDFHSTDRNLFYTQDETRPTDPPDFFETWFAAAQPRLQDYPFTNEPGPGKRPGVGKNYMYQRYGIPAATYEVGDETDRTAVREAARVFAEELMRLMLETPAPPSR